MVQRNKGPAAAVLCAAAGAKFGRSTPPRRDVVEEGLGAWGSASRSEEGFMGPDCHSREAWLRRTSLTRQPCGLWAGHMPPIRKGGGGSGTQNFVYQNGPTRFSLSQISFFPTLVALVRGGGVLWGSGGGLLLWLSVPLIHPWPTAVSSPLTAVSDSQSTDPPHPLSKIGPNFFPGLRPIKKFSLAPLAPLQIQHHCGRGGWTHPLTPLSPPKKEPCTGLAFMGHRLPQGVGGGGGGTPPPHPHPH